MALWGIPGGVAGVVSSELTKGYGCDSGIGCNFRDMVFTVRARSNARSGCAEDGISRWCGRRYQQCEGRSQLAGWTGLGLTG